MQTLIRSQKLGRPVGRLALYNYTSKHAYEAIETILDLMRNSKQDTVRFGAAKVLINKCLPDLKSVEGFIKDQKEIKITIGGAKPLASEILHSSQVAEIVKKRKEEIEGKAKEKTE